MTGTKLAQLVGVALVVTLSGCVQPGVGEATSDVEESASSELTLSAPVIEDLADDDIGLIARIHYATHTPDFDRARVFYRELGYTEGVTGFPLTNTHQMARALGMFDVCQYELAKGEVMALPGAENPASIDLLQFKIPFDGAAPYELPNHLGAAYAVFASADFENDVARISKIGGELLSEPYGENGSRFVFFRDPDGVLYQLKEAVTSDAGGETSTDGRMGIFDMPYVAINVSDLDASLAFYRLLGYQPVGEVLEYAGDGEEARAFGLAEEGMQYRTTLIEIARGDGHQLRLTQWLAPFDNEPPYPPPINRIGINRIAVLVTDLDRAVAILKAQGVKFLSELAPCCSGTGDDETAIVHAYDPDGVFIELVGSIAKRPPLPHPEHCPPMEIKLPAPT